MAKRTFAALTVLLLAALPVERVNAQVIPIAVDGCAKLARIVYSEVASAAVYGPGRSGPWLIEQAPGDISICEHAAKTVSQAFTSAMMSAGLDVNWRRDWDYGIPNLGDYCLSGFLSQCYPERAPLSSIASSADTTLVLNRWAVVSQTVMKEMYNPISSDEVRFRENDLRLRLGLSLRSAGVRYSD
jgi:hypothetical protein